MYLSKIKNIKGFTLFEVVVALAIFSVSSIFISDAFVKSNQAQRKTAALQKVQSDARYAMEAIAREVRSGRIDYEYYGNNVPAVSEELALIDRDEKKFIFKKETDPGLCPSAESSPCLNVSIDEGATWVSLTPNDIKIDSLKFFISPSADPFLLDAETGSYGPNEQPKVTIVLSTESLETKPEERSFVPLQTTISTRQYYR